MAQPANVNASTTRVRRSIGSALGILLTLWSSAHALTLPPARFDVPAGDLAASLELLSEQSGLQIVYDHDAVAGKRCRTVDGVMAPAEALDVCLEGSGLVWGRVDERTVVVRLPEDRTERLAEARVAEAPAGDDTTGLGDLNVVGDPLRVAIGGSAAAYGFDKSLVATPRSVSIVTSETIDLLGLSAVEDLVRVVPGVYTTTRWGIQGSVDVRNVPADTYFRGMKRVNLQGHGRSVLAAMETIEVVKGPPSPIYGMGKIGGYTNMEPKSVRAETGGYWIEPQGFVQGVSGSYDKSEISLGFGGPVEGPKRGGYYVYGLVEDSGSFVEEVPVRQSVVQAALNIDDFVGRFRLETGISLQRSQTAGALLGRFTQAVADSGRYLHGLPLVELDANGNGRIGYLEMLEGSAARGELSGANRPLRQYWAWPLDADGQPLPLARFPREPGIPEALFAWLTANPSADPDGLLRAQGVGGPAPISGYVPAGFALDPRTVGYGTLDPRHAGAFERELRADFVTAFFDLIEDTAGPFTVKNQLFFDGMDQFKISDQPFSQEQDVYVVEDKLTVSRELLHDDDRTLNGLLSANVRRVSSRGRTSSGDYATHRADQTSSVYSPPGAVFATALVDPDLDDDGMPWTDSYETIAWETGVGALLDFTTGATNVIVGGRVDYSRATNTEFAGMLDLGAGDASGPPVFTTADERASGRDTGTSWSASVSHGLPRGVRPYLTVARSSLALDGNNNRYVNAVIASGHIGSARLVEVGAKGELLDGGMYVSIAAYEQARDDVSADDDPALLAAHVSATTTRGVESELHWSPAARWRLSLYALRQQTRYTPNVGDAIMVDGRALGFSDVVAGDGAVVYPAEAFLYGGRSFLVLPDGVGDYERKQGNPDTQAGLVAQYSPRRGLGFTVSGNYFSSVYAGRLKLVELPAADVWNVGVHWEHGDWRLGWDVLNVFDEQYFRARTGDTLGEILVSSMPGRRWQAAFRLRF